MLRMIKEAAVRWNSDHSMRKAAALSFYTVFSLAPLLILAIAIAGFVWGQDAVRGELVSQLEGLIGKTSAQSLEKLIANTWKPTSNVVATILGVVTLFIGATAVFSELRSSLNEIWRAPQRKINGLWAIIRDRLLSFAMVAAIGFLLLVSLLANTVLSVLTAHFSEMIEFSPIIAHITYTISSFVLVAILFALVFKILPDKNILWKDVWIGAFLTSFLFTIGRFLIGFYIGRTAVASSYGASASLVVIMIWAYYSSLIVLFGAEFTQVFQTKRKQENPETPTRHLRVARNRH